MNTRTLSVLLAAALATSALSSIVSAADLPAAPVTYTKAPMVSPATNWSGFYGGANLGYGWGSGNTAIMDASPVPGASNLANQSFGDRSRGVFGGAQVGYNWQIGSFVAGLEADIQSSGISGVTQATLATALPPPAGTTNEGLSEKKLSWFGTARGRVGATVTPGLLLYGTGGLACGHVNNSSNDQELFPDGSSNNFPAAAAQTKSGWTVGAGAEWMFARGWSAKLEYLHVDLGRNTATAQQVNSDTSGPRTEFVAYDWHNSFDTVRAGVNYHFN